MCITNNDLKLIDRIDKYIKDMFIISSNYCCLLSTTSIFNYLVKYFF